MLDALLFASLLFQIPAPVCMMFIACPGPVAPTPSPSPETIPGISAEEFARIRAWNQMDQATRLTFWTTLTVEQQYYYWNSFMFPEQKTAFCVALGKPANCVPIPAP